MALVLPLAWDALDEAVELALWGLLCSLRSGFEAAFGPLSQPCREVIVDVALHDPHPS